MDLMIKAEMTGAWAPSSGNAALIATFSSLFVNAVHTFSSCLQFI